MNFVQNTLLGLYRGVRRTGFLATRPGRVLFEAVYWTYKSMIEARDVRSLKSYVVAGSTVIDVGANIGFFTVPFARWVGSEGQVISVEPEAVNFDSLRDRVQRLGLSNVVSLVNAAAIEVPGRVRLAVNLDNPADHRVAEQGIPVTAVTVDALVGERGWPDVSLIKIDVQGSELRVIRGALQTLRRFQPALFVELHEPSLVEAGTSTAELVGELLELGYAPYALDATGSWMQINEREIREKQEKMEARGYFDVLLLHRGHKNDA